MAPSAQVPTHATRHSSFRSHFGNAHGSVQNKVIGIRKEQSGRMVKHNAKHGPMKGKSTEVGGGRTGANNDVQATAIPDPIPTDAGTLHIAMGSTLTIMPTFSGDAVANAASSSTSISASVSEISETYSDVRSTTTIFIPASEVATPLSTFPVSSHSAQSTSVNSSSHLPIYGVVLLATGATGLALAAVLVLRCFLRRHGPVDRPRPSAPILQDSPLFGGMERFSRGIWSDPSFSNLLSTHTKNGKGDGWRPLSGGKQVTSEKTKNNRQSVFVTRNFTANNPMPPPMSPASVYTTAVPPTTIGMALDFPIPPKTVNASTQPLKVKDKDATGKTVRRRSVTASMYGTGMASPTLTETETAIAYQSPRPAPTPGKPKQAMKGSGSSRDNVQRPTRKNVPSRASQGSLYRSPSASRSVRGRDKDEPFLYALPSVKSQERRDRDTKALTSALGLAASPPPPSSCFSPVSIYPDDSLSVVHGRGNGRPFSEAPLSEMPSPAGTHAELGDLMLQEFPSTATFASLRTGDPFAGEPSVKKSTKGRVNDRPPRVPSPPPLPSLAQMALESAEPDYRSPTYSIYGLYEAQRKSKMSLGGN